MEINQNLNINELFQGLLESEIDKIEKNFSWEIYEKNQVVFYEKDQIKKVYIINSGSVEITKYDLNGSKNIVAILQDNDMFAESVSLSINSISPYTVTCLTKSKIGSINIDDFNKLARIYPMLLLNMQKILASKNTFLTFKIDCLSKKTIKERVYELLRYYSIQQNSLAIKIPFNKTQLADFLCINRSSLAREISKMIDEEIFTYKNKTYYLNKNIFF